MSEIPDEMRVALAKDYVRENFESGEPWSMTIARAVLAERERCAKIAESAEINQTDTEEPGDDEWFARMAANGQAAVIAAAIRSPGK